MKLNPTRRELIDALAKLSELTPDVRFGQLIANLSYAAVEPSNEAIWDVEDRDLLDAVNQQLAEVAPGEALQESHA